MNSWSSSISAMVVQLIPAHLPLNFTWPCDAWRQAASFPHIPIDGGPGSAAFNSSGSLSSSTVMPCARSSEILSEVIFHPGSKTRLPSSVDALLLFSSGSAAGREGTGRLSKGVGPSSIIDKFLTAI